jgi:hypothetical protein
MAHQFEFSAMHKGGLPGELYTAAGDGLAGEMAEREVGSFHAPLSDNVNILSRFSR